MASTNTRLSAPDNPAVAHIHPPKHETFDVGAGTNTDPKGFVRAVDTYRVTDFGLYMARPIDGHRKFAYIESWLLPELGLRVNEWRYQPGFSIDQDHYIDIVDVTTQGDTWQTVDLYLDLTVRSGPRLALAEGD